MKTRRPDLQRDPGLPPPPAPTARDANPWPMSSAPAGTPPAPGRPGAPGGRLRRRRALPWIPLLVLFFVVGTGVQMAIRALAEGDVEAAAGALVILAFATIVVLRRIVKRRRN